MLYFWIWLTLVLAVSPAEESIVSLLKGSWERQIQTEKGEAIISKIYSGTYFVYAVYTEDEFLEAGGGTWEINGNILTEIFEFNTANPDLVGQEKVMHVEVDQKELFINGKINQEWKRVDNGVSELSGAWRITGRKRNGEIQEVKMGPRKTFKILSGTRFQWAAFNVETKEFSGSGGGTYSLNEGKYTEKIEFFSRDNSRTGAELTFDYMVEGKEWHHSGMSSKGQPIYEIWTNQD